MNKCEKNVLVAGHICLDIIPEMHHTETSVAEIFRPGKLIDVGSSILSTGGAVPNTGLAMSRLGLNVKLVGKCGNDMFGKQLQQILKRELQSPETGMTIVADATTSYSIVFAPDGIDRIVFHCPGANNTFVAADVDWNMVKQSELFHFGYPPLMTAMYEKDGEELFELFSKVKSAGVTTSLDMALPDPTSQAEKADWVKIFKKVLPEVDIFLPSVEELLFMLDRSSYDSLLQKSDDGDIMGGITGELLSQLGNKCLDMGVAVVVIKCSSYGIYVKTANADRLNTIRGAKPADITNWTDREIFEPTFKVEKIVSAAGSGDNCIAGFLTAYLRDCDLENSMRYAAAVGAHNVQVRDTVSGVKSWNETTEDILNGWEKNKLKIPLNNWTFDTKNNCYIRPQDNSKKK